MFYHVKAGITGIISMFDYNKTKQEILQEYVCPFLNKEISLFENTIFNMSSFGYISIFESEKPVDSDWPTDKVELLKQCKDKYMLEYKYKDALKKKIPEVAKDVTIPFYQEALIMLESGDYRETRVKYIEKNIAKYSFFVCPLDDEEINDNYEYVIKPCVVKYGIEIQRADEITTTDTITSEIIGAINKSRFLIADLTFERPNCYYEVGYAHALGKPIVILAKERTERHFDISTYKWLYWKDYKDLKPKLEKEIKSIVEKIL